MSSKNDLDREVLLRMFPAWESLPNRDRWPDRRGEIRTDLGHYLRTNEYFGEIDPNG